MNPEMTEWEMKLVIQPKLKIPTNVYMTPAMKAICTRKWDRHLGNRIPDFLFGLAKVHSSTKALIMVQKCCDTSVNKPSREEEVFTWIAAWLYWSWALWLTGLLGSDWMGASIASGRLDPKSSDVTATGPTAYNNTHNHLPCKTCLSLQMDNQFSPDCKWAEHPQQWKFSISLGLMGLPNALKFQGLHSTVLGRRLHKDQTHLGGLQFWHTTFPEAPPRQLLRLRPKCQAAFKVPVKPAIHMTETFFL